MFWLWKYIRQMWGAGYILVSCAHSNTSFMWNIHNVNEFRGVRVTRSLVFCVCFVDGCLSFCNYFFWPLCGLFFNIRILSIPLVFSNKASYHAFPLNVECCLGMSGSRLLIINERGDEP